MAFCIFLLPHTLPYQLSLFFGLSKANVMSEKSALASVIEGRCPQCRQEKMFVSGPFTSTFLKMKKSCEHCGLQYEREPGFFYGAMYVSYILSVGILLVTGALVYYIGSDPDLWVYIVSVVLISLILYPINFRLSRIIFLHLFAGMKYDPEKAK